MKKVFVISALITFLMAFTLPQQKQKIVFFGDSITQAGVKPGGYITVLGDLLKQKNIQDELIGAGIGGNKVYDLYLRMEDDVLAKNPTTVVIWVGVNDVWHKKTSGTGTDANKFEGFYNALIKKLQAKNIKVLICTPAAIGEKTDYTNELDGDLNKYAAMIREIAKKNNVALIDLRKAFLDYNLANNPENKDRNILTTDGVHLNDKGNQLVAEQMLKALYK
ncbi:SGNH/GDSL hydrolase family protein [Paraflavitalea sp. CAU 1676]|uniref:SGNH/GDSL hydrolase family protein n=1 Tax=Paraflavitalea sp. CAU 1676 TaxID=3032598 RepID=UPI0023D9C48B|nr:SGNH/GDSL hydrolase family protein [Paraflavitalea sp. CAU 1676]MDF2190202.1 SGNH/GDSL hydrolase family protein [Paraflavitalea sp. CAU 1676]